MFRLFYRTLLLVCVLLVAGCGRGPDPAQLEGDVQARLDTLFGKRVLAIGALKRQGSAPYRTAEDGSKQVIVYFNAVVGYAEPYDPSDWQDLSPALIATALGAADEGIAGLKAGVNVPGDELRAYGSLVYRRSDQGWEPAVLAAPRPVAPPAVVDAAEGSAAGERMRRLAAVLQGIPARRGEDDQIIAAELDEALANITLRLKDKGKTVAIAAGPEGGEYQRFLSSAVARVPKPEHLRIVATQGSVANALMINAGDARLGLIQSDVAAAAVTGAGAFVANGPLGELRAVASLFPEPVHVVVRDDSPFNSISDLTERRVALGNVASGTRQTALALLAAAGIDVRGLGPVDQGNPQSALDKLAAGELDAVIEVVAAPWRQLVMTSEGVALRLLPLDADTVAKMTGTVPGLVALSIPARTYAGQEAPVPTVSATALLVARRDVPDAEVVNTLNLLYAAAASGTAGAQAARLSKERALIGITIPLHKAAARYFAPGNSVRPVAGAN